MSNSEKRVLITGVRGFTGHYVAAELQAAGYQVFGTAHGAEIEAAGNIDPHIFSMDLCDARRVQEVVEMVRPQIVIHLAAIAFVAHGDVEAMYRTNIVGTRNLLQALAACDAGQDAVLLASSANVYGNASVAVIDETVLPAPANDYAVSKLSMEYMARCWSERLPIIIARPFNYTGVGQSENFLLPKIVNHFRRKAREIELGNLDVSRDFSDVRQVAHAYRRLIEVAPIGQTFNICSGAAHSLAEVLGMMETLCGDVIQVRVNPAFARANEVKKLVGDSSKLAQTIGALDDVKHAVPLIDTLRWMLQHDVQ